MATKTNTAAPVIATVEMPKGKDCKGSVRFETADPNAPFTNLYVSRKLAGVDNAKAVKVTVELVP